LRRRSRTVDELVGGDERRRAIPGLTNAWTMPIKTRIDMLATGIKTPVASRSLPSLAELERIAAVRSKGESGRCRHGQRVRPSA